MKVSLTLEPGSLIRVETSGGGGFGDPAGRNPEARRADEEDGRMRRAGRSRDGVAR
jgi:N-methylhydantoinase B